MSLQTDEQVLTWEGTRLLPVFTPPQQLTVYDVRQMPNELQLSVASVVGLANRTQPRVYLNWRNNDLFWLKELLSDTPQQISPLKNEAILEELVTTYRHELTGLVIYDPNCPDSINAATMLAALENALVVSPTQAPTFQAAPYALPVLDDLRTQHWTNRVQVYRWALKHLLPRCTPRLIAGLNPQTAMGVRPYLVATRAFIYWLNPLGLKPQSAAHWDSEHWLLKRILRTCPDNTVHLGWFLQEGSGVTLTSHAAIPVIASDYYSNLEVWSALPAPELPPPAPADPLPTVQSNKTYLSFTMSEGDNAQYMQERMIDIWRNPARGSLPIGWAISLSLLQASPAMTGYYQRTVTANDELVAGPSGTAYMYPTRWPAEKREAYLRQTGELMQQANLSLLQVLDSNYWLHPKLIYRAIKTGSGLMMINKSVQQHFVKGLRPYGLRGILSGGGLTKTGWQFVDGIPIYQNLGTAGSVEQAVTMVREATEKQHPRFINLYVLAWQLGPAELKKVAEQLGSDFEIVKPSTLLALLSSAQ